MVLAAASHFYAKVERAKQHIIELEKAKKRFLRRKPYRAFIDADSSPPDHIVRVKVREEVPEDFSLITGDAVHNLRSALDLLVYQLAGDSAGDKTGFPIGRNFSHYESVKSRKVRGAHPDAVKLIDALKPYKGGNEALWRIHVLDIEDKHHLLIAAQVVIPDSGGLITIATRDYSSIPVPISDPKNTCPLEDGAELCRFSPIAAFAGKGKVNVKPQFPFDIAFGELKVAECEAVIPTLHQLADFVEGLIKPFLGFLTKP